jgi:hypothetical protein
LGLLLSGCGGQASQVSPAALNILSQNLSARSNSKRLSSSQNLLYVVNQVDANVYVYTFPQSQSVATLTGFVRPQGECVDAAGDVFIVSAQSTAYQSPTVITEYAHGGVNPIAILSEPSGGTGCAIDQTSGNLAVSGGYVSDGYVNGDVAIFNRAQGNPTMYYSSLQPFEMCGYDSKGNLYISAASLKYVGEYHLVRLPKDAKKFVAISLAQELVGSGTFPPSVQWDGSHMTVSNVGGSDNKVSEIYRLSFSGRKASIVETTFLKTAHPARSGQIWIDGSQVIGSDYESLHGGIDWWSYPNAHKHHTVVPNTPNLAPFGIAVSNGSE